MPLERLHEVADDVGRFPALPPGYLVGTRTFYTFTEAFPVAAASGETVFAFGGPGELLPCRPVGEDYYQEETP